MRRYQKKVGDEKKQSKDESCLDGDLRMSASKEQDARLAKAEGKQKRKTEGKQKRKAEDKGSAEKWQRDDQHQPDLEEEEEDLFAQPTAPKSSATSTPVKDISRKASARKSKPVHALSTNIESVTMSAKQVATSQKETGKRSLPTPPRMSANKEQDALREGSLKKKAKTKDARSPAAKPVKSLTMVNQNQTELEEEENLFEQKISTPVKERRSPSAPKSKLNGKPSAKKISLSAKEKSKLGRSHQPQSDSHDEDLRTKKSKEEDNAQWCTEGNEHIGKRARRYVFDSRGELTDAADGIIAGWLSKEKSDFFAKSGKPAALWHLMYDNVMLGEEDLEEHEVLEAIDLMSTEVPACIAAQQAKATCSSSSKQENSAAKGKERISATSALSSNRQNEDQFEAADSKSRSKSRKRNGSDLDLFKDKEAKKLLNMFAKDKQWDEQEEKLKVVVGAHAKIVVSLPCSLEKSTQDDVKQTLKEVIAVVAHVEREAVSIDFGNRMIAAAIKLPCTKGDFNEDKQYSFRKAVSKASGTSVEDVKIRSITDVAGNKKKNSRDKGFARFDFSVAAASADAATKTLSVMSSENLNKILMQEGLSEGVIISELKTSTQVEVRVGVPPQQEEAEEIFKRLTEPAIKTVLRSKAGPAAQEMSNISVVEAAVMQNVEQAGTVVF